MEKFMIYLLMFFTLVMIICISTGCNSEQKKDDTSVLPPVPETSKEIVLRTIYKMDWFATFCLLGFFGGMVAIGLDQRKIGGAVVIASVATISFGLGVQRFPTWLAIIGFAASIIAVGYSVLIKQKALVEMIRGIQNYRDSKVEHDDIDGYLYAAQKGTSTAKVVEKVKKKLEMRESKEGDTAYGL